MTLLYLEYDNLLNYLCSSGIFTFDEVIDGNLVIKKKLTKNNTFEVYSKCKGVFVKQFTEFYKYPFNNLWREQLIRNYDPFYTLNLHSNVRLSIPDIEKIDFDRQVIITKRIENLERLKTILETNPQNLDLDSIINIIDKLHKTANINRNLKRKLDFTPYFFDRILNNSFRHRDKADFLFWSKFKIHKKVLSDFLRKHWAKQEMLIHNDLSLNNILLSDKTIYLIDWEYLSIGDKLWDFASLIYDIEFSKDDNKPIYKTFIDKIYDFHKDSLSKEILAFYVISIRLWRKSLDIEKISKKEELEKLLKECDAIISDFVTKLNDIVKKL